MSSAIINTEDQIKGRPILFRAHPGPQTDFLVNTAFECLFASSVGQGKSLCLLIEAVRYIDNPNYNAILFRRTMADLEKTLIKDSRRIYDSRISALGGTYNEVKKTWTFPSGATITFGYIDSEKDLMHYQGWQGQYVGFDELTHFTEEMYLYMFSRLRTNDPSIPVRIRAATNPGGIGHDWVYSRWNNWLNPQSKQKLKSGQVARVRMNTRSCVVSYMGDNTSIDSEEYSNRISAISNEVTKQQLLNNDWQIRPGAANFFKRELMPVIPIPQYSGRSVRGWDLAATQDGGDWTVGVRLTQHSNKTYTVEDVVRKQLNPDGVDRLILNCAHADGPRCKIILSIDPGQAGIAQKMYYSRLLNGFSFEFVKDHKKKHERALPISSQCLAGNVSVVASSAWNKAFFDELEAFGEDPKMYKHDDQVDALATAYNALLHARAEYRDLGIEMPKRMI